MRHLAANFTKKFKGKFFDENLWPCSLTFSLKKHNYHLRQLYSKPDVKDYLDEHHSKIWARALFNEKCKLDYVNNNLAESFNSKIRKWKGLHIVDLLDKIRQVLMEKFDLRQSISTGTYGGHIIVPKVMKQLMAKSKTLDMSIVKRSTHEAEVTAIDKEKREWRYPVDLQAQTCSYRKWQITGQPCIHALYFITSLRGPASEIDQYVHEFYSVHRFNLTYAKNLPTMEGKQQWDVVDTRFKLCAPVQNRPPVRPRKTRISLRAQAEGKGLGGRKKKCSRCGRLGHRGTHCKESIDLAFGEDKHWGAENALENALAIAPSSPPSATTSLPTTPSSPPAPSSPPTAPSSAPAPSSLTALVRYVFYYMFMHSLCNFIISYSS